MHDGTIYPQIRAAPEEDRSLPAPDVPPMRIAKVRGILDVKSASIDSYRLDVDAIMMYAAR